MALKTRFISLSGLFIIATLLNNCRLKPQENGGHLKGETLFNLLDSGKTHIQFSNVLTEDQDHNVLLYQYFYNGAGVAIADLNGDGLQDIYFTANMADNKLYLNKGHLQFKDITDAAGVAGRADGWKTGVTMVDINGDNKMDIYVCYSGSNPIDKRKNQLFINQGNDAQGIPHFKEEAEQYGLADGSFSTQAYFFDYDGDGDLDMLLVNHNPRQFTNLDDVTVPMLEKIPDPMSGTKLFRNDGGHFNDVTQKSGIRNSGLSYGLAAGIADINGDGWPDIYLSNDYAVPDHLYINNRDGTFTDQLSAQIGHISLFSMGNDIADINNDLLLDIYTLDMLPESNARQKNFFIPNNYGQFNQNLRVGFYYQYMRNMLHINNGNNTFSEVGQAYGISNTDWSWAPLLADYDNDGLKDLFVSNGVSKDLTNNDFIKYRSDLLSSLGTDIRKEHILELLAHMPTSDIKSYFFKNQADGSFKDVSSAWGISLPAKSNGAAYADLDNDGDLDLVVNNINQSAFVYENTSNQKPDHHYLEFKLSGNGLNTQGIGAKIAVYCGDKTQFIEQMPTRGYQSSVSPVLHFGIGAAKQVDSLRIVWPQKKQQTIKGIKADQLITLREQDAKTAFKTPDKIETIFSKVNSPLAYTQKKTAVNDFKRQPLMISPMSFSTPCMVKGDVNGDGLEDVYIGGGYSEAGKLYIQNKEGQFKQQKEPAFELDKAFTDASAIFFDANGDGKPDLYVASGGYDDLKPDDPLLQDRLYINDGRGNLTRSANSLPQMPGSKGCVVAADVNGDGYQDLFVGGRVIPGRYPESPESYLLINDGKGHFTNETRKLAPKLAHIGMVTDAAWVDMNNDGRLDLVLVGEWVPVTIMINVNGKLVDRTKEYMDKQYTGWWNKLLVTDLNHDGHPDLIIGNLGLNSQCKASNAQPAEMYYKDFDNNGTVDPVLCLYIQGKSYPFLTREELLDQFSVMRWRFPDYKSFANANIRDVFTPRELQGAGHLSANDLKTSCFLSGPNGKLSDKPLPVETQNSPVFNITALDYDHDGKTDLLMFGNCKNARLRFGKYDANYGILLKGDGLGNFEYIPQYKSGFKVEGDVRSVLTVNNTLLIGVNQSKIEAYKQKK